MAALRAGKPLRVGAVTLVPIERSGIASSSGAAGYWLSAVKEAFHDTFARAWAGGALAVDTADVALDALIRETPNLGAILSELSAS